MKLAVCLLLVALIPATVDSQTHHKRHKTKQSPAKLGQLRSDLERVRQQKKDLRSQLRKTNRAVSSVMDDIAAVDSQLTDLESQLAATGDKLDGAKAEQTQLESDLADAGQRLDTLRGQISVRIRRMYIEGDGTALAALAGSASVGELASREYVVERIARQDRKLFDDYSGLKAAIADHVEKQQALVNTVADLQDRQSAQQGSLRGDRDKKDEYLGELREKQGEIKEALQQFEDDERQIGAEIEAYSARRRASGAPQLPAFSGRFLRPVAGRISDSFGMRYHPILHVEKMHWGIDIAAPSGTLVHAAASGVVISAQYMRGYGNMISIDHGGGYSTVYGHLSRILVSPGQSVARGENIGAVGMTGLATGPHLHWEVRINNKPVNPIGR